MMAGIRGKNTKPELSIRRLLFARGLRYRIHGRGLPGRPDVVFAKHRAVLFIHGCFWHGHDCRLFRLPASNTEFWRDKIASNRRRDERAVRELGTLGWRVLVIWECSFRGAKPDALVRVGNRAARWVGSTVRTGTIRGRA